MSDNNKNNNNNNTVHMYSDGWRGGVSDDRISDKLFSGTFPCIQGMPLCPELFLVYKEYLHNMSGAFPLILRKTLQHWIAFLNSALLT